LSLEGGVGVSNQNVTIDPCCGIGGPFKVGDTIKIEGHVQAGGSILITRMNAQRRRSRRQQQRSPASSANPRRNTFDDDG
jgi:UDP-3-O-[3-hydroxymyristoyl] glucosamine N-acyltransferase